MSLDDFPVRSLLYSPPSGGNSDGEGWGEREMCERTFAWISWLSMRVRRELGFPRDPEQTPAQITEARSIRRKVHLGVDLSGISNDLTHHAHNGTNKTKKAHFLTNNALQLLIGEKIHSRTQYRIQLFRNTLQKHIIFNIFERYKFILKNKVTRHKGY